MNIKILMLGDVVGTCGCEYLLAKGRLRQFVRERGVSLVIANGENSAEGNGITPTSAKSLMEAGVDVITGGNHTLRKKNIYSMLDDESTLIRPANYPSRSPGCGHVTVEVYGYRILIINLAGQVYMDTHISSPFEKLDNILSAEAGRYDAAVVDIHAEATSEKLALARYSAGRVAAVAGTHTHIPTADVRVLDGGTGYITDLGMCGSHAGVLGVRYEDVLHKFLSVLPVSFNPAEGEVEAQGAVFTVELPSGKCTHAEAVRF